MKFKALSIAGSRWREAKVLIIDEISMIDAVLFGKVDAVGRFIRDCDKKPFGGVQVVLCGDFCQLPPVVRGERKFCFQSPIWNEMQLHVVALTKVFRQEDASFVALLNELRRGKLTQHSLAVFNECRHHSPVLTNGIVMTKLYPHKADVDGENTARLAELPGETMTFTAKDMYYNQAAERSESLNQSITPKQLMLRVGAQVLCTKNIDADSGLVNGSRGVVMSFVSESEARAAVQGKLARDPSRWLSISSDRTWPVVKFACGITKVMVPEIWSLQQGDVLLAERFQVPLQLAWAVTVHKSQGMTLDAVETSLSKAFDHGMVYVALSRVRSLNGLRLTSFDPRAITADHEVLRFYEHISDPHRQQLPYLPQTLQQQVQPSQFQIPPQYQQYQQRR
eukprot:TRINITY_DN6072_c0_g2_i1.p1 TRINITY_DN6072_c0_g2~~TRINITY_DN6072_c0_g2_i1.p1  ORF type:complete len:394 (+),score=81.27 TRINITY_DN6072_c0_g2_i1:735-1916(+)